MPNSPAPEVLFVRLYLDRHIMARLAVDLRSHGYDVLRTEEAGLDTASDEEQLEFAARETGYPDLQHTRLCPDPRAMVGGRSITCWNHRFPAVWQSGVRLAPGTHAELAQPLHRRRPGEQPCPSRTIQVKRIGIPRKSNGQKFAFRLASSSADRVSESSPCMFVIPSCSSPSTNHRQEMDLAVGSEPWLPDRGGS